MSIEFVISLNCFMWVRFQQSKRCFAFKSKLSIMEELWIRQSEKVIIKRVYAIPVAESLDTFLVISLKIGLYQFENIPVAWVHIDSLISDRIKNIKRSWGGYYLAR